MKRPIALLALLGLVGCFLPLVGGFSFFELRQLEYLPIVLMTLAFAVPLIAGMHNGLSSKGTAVAGLAGFGYVIFKLGTALWSMTIHGQIGGKMMAVSAVVGFAASLLALAERDRA